MKKLFCLILCLIIAFSSVSVFAQGYEAEKNALSPLEAFTQKLTQLTKEYDSDDEIAVFSAESVDENELAHKDSTKRLIVKAEGKIDTLNAVEHIEGYNDLHILQFDTYSDMEAALSYYKECDNVIYAQEDCINKTAEYEIEEENVEYNVINDNTLSSNTVSNPMQECSDNHGFTGLRKKLADRNVVYTEEITVAVIDTGVEADHELLAGRVEPTGFDAIDGVSCADMDGHGTHVAGIIVANTLDNVTVKPYRVLDENGEGSDAQVALGIEAAIADGVDVINMSLGRRGTSEIMDEAVKKANDAGIIVVTSAGNDGAYMQVEPYTPACCDNVITVQACHQNLYSYPSWTNWGKMCETYAIGVNVRSSYLGNTYATLKGTSMAAPFVAAAVTYMILDNPDTTYQSAVDTIEKFEYNECMHIEYIFDEGIPQVPTPTFSVESGEFDDEFYLELSCDFEGASIHYNLSTSGSVSYKAYTQPIKIKYDTVVTIYAIKIGAINSEKNVATYTRIFPDDEDRYVIDSSGYITEYLGPTGEDDAILVIPDTIDGIAPVGIKREVFYNFDFLVSVVFPDSLKTIEEHAFSYCDNLQYVRAPGLTNISSYAFGGCANLKEFDATNLTRIDSYAFAGCKSLRFLYLRNATYIGGNAFNGAGGVQIAELDNIRTIQEGAFTNSNVREVIIPYATALGDKAFKNCTSLESVSIPLVTELQYECFYGCTSLKEITADSLTYLTRHNFYNCTSLEEVNFPSLIRSGSNPLDANFFDCTALKTFIAPKLQMVGGSCFSGCTSLETITVPLLNTINDGYAFRNCTSLKTFVAPKLGSVAAYSFDNCSNLETVNTPLLLTIGSYAFQNCTSLKAIDCSNVNTLGEDAFAGCTALGELYFGKGITIPTNAFQADFTADKIIFNVPLVISDLPSGVPVAIPSSLKTINVQSPENVIIYGSSGSYAETWATENGQTFIEITPETAIFTDVAPYCYSYDQELIFDVIGFKRTYQWYGTNEKSTTDGIAISGAKSNTFSPCDYDTIYNYYYCVATSKDGKNDMVYITSSLCTYSKTSVTAQGDATIDFTNLILFTACTGRNILSDMVTFGGNEKYIPVPSYSSGSTDYFGTGSAFIVYTDGVPDSTFQIVVYGDVNGDSICNVVDCIEAEKTANGHQELTNVYSLAADTDQNGTIDVTDYQDIVNRAMSKI